jgi:(heptosyl)LPS beta-1,4-glucosyltransferase
MNKSDISAVIVTWNEEKNIKRAIASIKPYVQEIVVVDMSTNTQDKTAQISKSLGARVFKHKYVGYVEPARQFAIQKASCKWVFMLDADEEITSSLGNTLSMLTQSNFTHFFLPRKNIIFNKWLMHSRWWPDYIIRFFQKTSLEWPSQIHSQPIPRGEGQNLEAVEENAIIHHHYTSISEYIERLNRYTDFQLKKLIDDGYVFEWKDLIKKPTNEFLSRFYDGQGYADGLHGLAVSFLQSFSELVLYLKAWEHAKFVDTTGKDMKNSFEDQIRVSIKDWKYWVGRTGRLIDKIAAKLT